MLRNPFAKQLLGATAAISLTVSSLVAQSLMPIGNYETGRFDEAAAEITAFDPGSNRLFLVNADDGSVDILDLSNPAAPALVNSIDIDALFGPGEIAAEPNSVDICDGLVAVAIARIDEGDNDLPMTGLVGFFDIFGNYLTASEVGYLPDMITFSPDGSVVLTANEGEPAPEYDFDPQGSVSIINVNFLKNRLALLERFPQFEGRLRWIAPRARHATFERFELPFFQRRFDLTDLRIFGPNASLAQDMEPEYISVSEDSRTAYVSLQENNALAVIDIRSARVTSINPFGFKNWSQSALDPSNRDDGINIAPWPIYGMYQPDAIASWSTGVGRNKATYVITANEGDARDYDGFGEEARIKDIVLDPTRFPNAATLQQDANLGRLNITTTRGDIDGDGDFDELYAFGARSFSIWMLDWRNNMTQVFDSGSILEEITADLLPEVFNTTNDETDFDGRSDDKGPEPEGLDIGVVDAKTYLFLGLERIGGVMVFDISNPASPIFHEYVNVRDFDADPETPEAGDLGPEGVLFIPAADSPNGQNLVVVANEISGNVRIFTFE